MTKNKFRLTNYALSQRKFNEESKSGTENVIKCCLDIKKLSHFCHFEIVCIEKCFKSPFDDKNVQFGQTHYTLS